MPNKQKLQNLSGQAHIVGVAESNKLGKVPEKSPLVHHSEAAINALDDAGLQFADVDALFTAGWSTLDVAEYLGIHPRYTDSTSVGGSSFVIHVAHALAAIAAGYCEVALITHGQSGRSDRAPIHVILAPQWRNTRRRMESLVRLFRMQWQRAGICMSTVRIGLVRRWQKLPSRLENGPI